MPTENGKKLCVCAVIIILTSTLLCQLLKLLCTPNDKTEGIKVLCIYSLTTSKYLHVAKRCIQVICKNKFQLICKNKLVGYKFTKMKNVFAKCFNRNNGHQRKSSEAHFKFANQSESHFFILFYLFIANCCGLIHMN